MSNPRTALRLSLFLEWVFRAAGTLLGLMMLEEPGMFIPHPDALPSEFAETFHFLLHAIALVTAFGASVAVWMRRRWARFPYALATLLLVLLRFVAPPSVLPPITAGLDAMSLLLSGFTIALSCYATAEMYQNAKGA